MYCERIKQAQEERRPIVYIDESGFSHDMPRKDTCVIATMIGEPKVDKMLLEQ
jgi:pseudouridine-5'-phosphate glycosidase